MKYKSLEIKKYIDTFNINVKYSKSESAIKKLIKKFPKNNDLESVLLKATTINSLYSTNIYDIVNIARHITQIKNIDERLEEGDFKLIDEIARNHQIKNSKGTKLNFHSFACKYCAFHNSDKFIIYDSFVENQLYEINKTYNFSSFKKSDLKNYTHFIKVMNDLKAFCNNEYSLSDLDKFLWIKEKQKEANFCPICNQKLHLSKRYRNYVCEDCFNQATNEKGEKLSFYNLDASGGFQSFNDVTNEKNFHHHICYIKGYKCFADEAYLGGIVIEKILDN